MRAEQIAKDLDALPDSAETEPQLTGHAGALLAYYGYADIDAPLRHHAQAMLMLGRRVRNAAAIAQAYEALARTAGDYLHADSALLLLDQGELLSVARPLGRVVPRRGSSLCRALLSLYRLRGDSRDPDSRRSLCSMPPDTLRELAGRRKGPLAPVHGALGASACRNSYPGMNQLAAHFAGRAFEAVFSTDLYGYFGSTTNRLSPADEIAADRNCTTSRIIRFRSRSRSTTVARLALRAKPGAPPLAVVAETQRRATLLGRGAFPQMFVIDKRGVIRATITGWDPGAEERPHEADRASCCERGSS